jgi:recombination protein RecR
MFPPVIQKLIDLFSRFPTVGPRTAARFIFYLIKLPQKEFDELIKSTVDLRKKIKICSFCFNPFDASVNSAQVTSASSEEEKLCSICHNASRDKNLLCIVEKETDLISIEKAKKYKGLYFILGGNFSVLKKEDIEKIKIKELEERIKNPENFGQPDANFKEVIIATNPTTEGEATALYIERELKKLQLPESRQSPKITRLGRGLPVGGELEYADEETLGSAFEGRK